MGGQGRSKIGRLLSDGSIDPDFDPGVVGNFVWALESQPDGKILVGGSFTELGGQARGNIGRLYPGDLPQYQVSVTAGDSNGTVTGGGAHAHNALVTLTATPSQGQVFSHWAENGQKVSGAEATYSFYATANRTLQAHFRKNTQAGVLLLLLDE